MHLVRLLALVLSVLLWTHDASARIPSRIPARIPRPLKNEPEPVAAPRPAPACNPQALPGVLWWGTRRTLTVEELARYAAPVLWFSPDEPSLAGADGAAIRHPEAFPFERPGAGPIVYYQITDLLAQGDGSEETALTRKPWNISGSNIDLRSVAALNLSFYAYFATEEGLGAHPYDIEPVEFRLVVVRASDVEDEVGQCDPDLFFIRATRVSAKAHGLVWFWNVLETDASTFFPMHILVEEGKHGLATDKNADGAFTPGYDVNVRINDAWGARDVIRTGYLFTGGYEAWMTKQRRPEHRVLPPLPDDSPLRATLARKIENRSLAVYEVRPYPPSARASDPVLRRLVAYHERPGWPEIDRVEGPKQLTKFVTEGTAIKSFSVSAYADGDVGFSFVFPLLIVSHVNDPMTGGYLLNRVVIKDHYLRDFSWLLLYMPSASRWVDSYLAAGYERDVYEIDQDETGVHHDFVFEGGVKLRANISKTPLKPLTFFTDYWGLRAGIKNRGFWTIDRLTYVFEIGAGSF